MAITYTQAQTLTPDQYHNSFVNFYQQVLGIKGTYSGGGDDTSDEQEETTTGVSYNVSPRDDDDMSPFVPGSSFVKSDGTMDINVMALDPKNINSKISESEAFGSKTFRNDRVNLFNLPDDSSLREKITDNLEPAVKGVFAAASSMGQTSLVGAGLTGGFMSSLIGGETYKDEMGNTQFDPTGNPVLSAMGQITRDARKDILTRIAAEAEANPSGDLGFAASIGNLMVVRGPGDVSYSGNRQGLSFQQIKNIEALSKGILPDTFRFEKDKDGQSGLFMGNKRINTGIEESGGVYLDPNNKQAGFYRADGAIYTHRFGYAPVGMMSDVETLAKNYFPGMDAKTARDLALSAIQNARAGSGTLQSNLRDAASSTIYNMDMDFLDDEDKYSGIRTREEDLELQREQEAQQKAERAAASNRAIQAAKRRTESKQNVVDRREQRDISEVQKLQKEDPTFEDAFNRGGFIGMNNGGSVPDQGGQSGFVDGVPPSQATDAQEVADDRRTQLPEGAFVLNASSVEFAGEQDISKMLLDAHEEAIRRGAVSQGTSVDATRKMIDVAISRGEVVVAPYMVKIIGLDRLEKINKRGIRDTERKIEENGQQVQGAAKGKLINTYRGEPLDSDEVDFTVDYGYGKEDVGKFHTPDINRAKSYVNTPFVEKGNRVIKSRKVTVDELFDGVKDAWKTHAKQNTDYFARMPKSELKKNIDFIDTLKEEVKSGKGRSINDIAIFIQEQVFHDDKSKINFIETFKNDPKSAFKLAGRAMTKIATKMTPPIAILEMAVGAFAPTTVADATLQGENGQELEGAAIRRSFLRGGFLDSAVGLDSPTLTSPQGTEDIPLPDNSGMSKNNNMYFDYRFGDIKDAIRQVEIKGFEDQPYIFTGVKKKGGKASSAFGPMQITSSTLRDLKERSGDYEMFSDDIKDYVEKLIQQGDDKVNLELYGSVYRDEKRQTIGKDARNKLKGYGAGIIPIDDHEKYYEVVSDATLKQKLLDHGTLEEALSSYGEGMEYASKVLKGLGISKN